MGRVEFSILPEENLVKNPWCVSEGLRITLINHPSQHRELTGIRSQVFIFTGGSPGLCGYLQRVPGESVSINNRFLGMCQ